MTILITGGTGLVGSRLLARLAAAGLPCRALLRSPKTLPAGVDPIHGDLLDADSLRDALSGVTAIIHLAAVLRTPDPDQIWAANLEGTRNLIAATMAHAPQARFILASTSNVYAADAPRPGREDDAVAPKHPYPASKIAAEALLRASPLTSVILRFGFVYGEGDGHLETLPNLARQYQMHPAAKLSVIHHRDIAALVQLALGGAFDGRTVNATDDAPMSIFEMCQIAGDEIPPSSEPLAHPWSGQMDGRLARAFGFIPTVPTLHQAVRDGLL